MDRRGFLKSIGFGVLVPVFVPGAPFSLLDERPKVTPVPNPELEYWDWKQYYTTVTISGLDLIMKEIYLPAITKNILNESSVTKLLREQGIYGA